MKRHITFILLFFLLTNILSAGDTYLFSTKFGIDKYIGNSIEDYKKIFSYNLGVEITKKIDKKINWNIIYLDATLTNRWKADNGIFAVFRPFFRSNPFYTWRFGTSVEYSFAEKISPYLRLGLGIQHLNLHNSEFQQMVDKANKAHIWQIQPLVSCGIKFSPAWRFDIKYNNLRKDRFNASSVVFGIIVSEKL